MSERNKPTLREAVHSLYESFQIASYSQGHPYIQSIGEAANTGTIHVYLVRKVRSHERLIPESWEGWPIETHVIGRIVIGPA
jgi:hypothetical protein